MFSRPLRLYIPVVPGLVFAEAAPINFNCSSLLGETFRVASRRDEQYSIEDCTFIYIQFTHEMAYPTQLQIVNGRVEGVTGRMTEEGIVISGPFADSAPSVGQLDVVVMNMTFNGTVFKFENALPPNSTILLTNNSFYVSLPNALWPASGAVAMYFLCTELSLVSSSIIISNNTFETSVAASSASEVNAIHLSTYSLQIDSNSTLCISSNTIQNTTASMPVHLVLFVSHVELKVSVKSGSRLIIDYNSVTASYIKGSVIVVLWNLLTTGFVDATVTVDSFMSITGNSIVGVVSGSETVGAVLLSGKTSITLSASSNSAILMNANSISRITNNNINLNVASVALQALKQLTIAVGSNSTINFDANSVFLASSCGVYAIRFITLETTISIWDRSAMSVSSNSASRVSTSVTNIVSFQINSLVVDIEASSLFCISYNGIADSTAGSLLSVVAIRPIGASSITIQASSKFVVSSNYISESSSASASVVVNHTTSLMSWVVKNRSGIEISDNYYSNVTTPLVRVLLWAATVDKITLSLTESSTFSIVNNNGSNSNCSSAGVVDLSAKTLLAFSAGESSTMFIISSSLKNLLGSEAGLAVRLISAGAFTTSVSEDSIMSLSTNSISNSSFDVVNVVVIVAPEISISSLRRSMVTVSGNEIQLANCRLAVAASMATTKSSANISLHDASSFLLGSNSVTKTNASDKVAAVRWRVSASLDVELSNVSIMSFSDNRVVDVSAETQADAVLCWVGGSTVMLKNYSSLVMTGNLLLNISTIPLDDSRSATVCTLQSSTFWNMSLVRESTIAISENMFSTSQGYTIVSVVSFTAINAITITISNGSRATMLNNTLCNIHAYRFVGILVEQLSLLAVEDGSTLAINNTILSGISTLRTGEQKVDDLFDNTVQIVTVSLSVKLIGESELSLSNNTLLWGTVWKAAVVNIDYDTLLLDASVASRISFSGNSASSLYCVGSNKFIYTLLISGGLGGSKMTLNARSQFSVDSNSISESPSSAGSLKGVFFNTRSDLLIFLINSSTMTMNRNQVRSSASLIAVVDFIVFSTLAIEIVSGSRMEVADNSVFDSASTYISVFVMVPKMALRFRLSNQSSIEFVRNAIHRSNISYDNAVTIRLSNVVEVSLSESMLRIAHNHANIVNFVGTLATASTVLWTVTDMGEFTISSRSSFLITNNSLEASGTAVAFKRPASGTLAKFLIIGDRSRFSITRTVTLSSGESTGLSLIAFLQIIVNGGSAFELSDTDIRGAWSTTLLAIQLQADLLLVSQQSHMVISGNSISTLAAASRVIICSISNTTLTGSSNLLMTDNELFLSGAGKPSAAVLIHFPVLGTLAIYNSTLLIEGNILSAVSISSPSPTSNFGILVMSSISLLLQGSICHIKNNFAESQSTQVAFGPVLLRDGSQMKLIGNTFDINKDRRVAGCPSPAINMLHITSNSDSSFGIERNTFSFGATDSASGCPIVQIVSTKGLHILSVCNNTVDAPEAKTDFIHFGNVSVPEKANVVIMGNQINTSSDSALCSVVDTLELMTRSKWLFENNSVVVQSSLYLPLPFTMLNTTYYILANTSNIFLCTNTLTDRDSKIHWRLDRYATLPLELDLKTSFCRIESNSPTISISRNDSKTISVSRSLVVPIVPVISPVPAAVETAKQVQNAAGVVVAVTAVASATGGQLGVANALMRLADCSSPDDDDDSLPILVHPLQFSFGHKKTLKHAAGAISDTLLLPLIVVIIALGPARLLIMRLRSVPSRAALVQIGWPTLLVLPFANLAEGIGVTTTTALISGEPFGVGMGFVALLVLLTFTGSWVWILIRVVPRSRLQLLRQEGATGLGKKRAFLMRMVRPSHRWVPLAPAEGSAKKKINLADLERYGNAVGDKRWYYADLVSFVCSILVGVCECLPPSICRERAVIALIPALLQCGLSVLALIPLERFLQSLLAVCLVPMYIVVVVKVFSGSASDSEYDDLLDSAMAVFSSASNAIGIAIMGLGLVVGLWEVATTHRGRLRRKLPATPPQRSLYIPMLAADQPSGHELEEEATAFEYQPSLSVVETVEKARPSTVRESSDDEMDVREKSTKPEHAGRHQMDAAELLFVNSIISQLKEFEESQL